MPTVSVKWQKQVFPAVEIDTTQPPLVFKCQLYDLTGVPPERQKIMVKGGLLKDDADWSTVGVKEGQKLMMMGTADEVVKAPENGPVFMEDLPEEEQVVAVGHSAGLFNLGNTCYMNSTLQCLHSVPELKSALLSLPTVKSNDVDQNTHLLTSATRDLFNELDRNVRPVAPLQFLSLLRKKYPQFAQQQNGVYMQQDAEECWTQLMYTLSQALKQSGSSSDAPDPVKELFGIDLVSRVYCVESGEESSETESIYALKCHISQDVNHLHEGLKHGLKSELEKVSPSLRHSAIYLKESRIESLPRYLTVQFVRFFWKRETKQKAKILRKVDYPLELDVYDFCSDKLRQNLQAPRQLLRDSENAKLGLKVKENNSSSNENDAVPAKSEEGSSVAEASTNAYESGGNVQLTGIYDLVAVLTHKGRSADSGHYVSWVKQENGKWVQFDDDNPIPQREEDITRLSGGGDWHMAYICMYKARVIKS